MVPRATPPKGEQHQSSADAHARLQKFRAALCARATRLGSRDPEGAAQETWKRSLQNGSARAAVDFYFGDDSPDAAAAPEWPLDQLFAWLHGVLTNVVREENDRASRWREIPFAAAESDWPAGKHTDPADPAADPLDELIDREIRGIVAEALPKLARNHRAVLQMRIEGMKYGEIADRLGVSLNTVATWVSRGLGELGEQIKRRTARVRPSRGSRT
jgi:RNA polymerase sigma factor (sigma-70 family)